MTNEINGVPIINYTHEITLTFDGHVDNPEARVRTWVNDSGLFGDPADVTTTHPTLRFFDKEIVEHPDLHSVVLAIDADKTRPNHIALRMKWFELYEKAKTTIKVASPDLTALTTIKLHFS